MPVLRFVNGNYAQAFTRYHDLFHSFVKANQQFGVWVSEFFLTDTHVSKAMAEERSNKILSMIKTISNGIDLPHYE